MLQDETDEDVVERFVFEGQIEDVGHLELDVGSAIGHGSLLRNSEGVRREIA